MGTAVARYWTAMLAVVTALALAGPATADAATSITIDGSQGGRTFDGIGAISGGGGNSRLLIDYPEPQRSQVLDYLFKPGYGADLQVLKLEIGGDANSTDGSEPSIEHTKGAVNCGGGYEWWLAEQAKSRNPNIELYGLAWAAPGWIGNGNFWSQDMVDYLMTWLGCARQHGLGISFLGGWNERGYDKGWYENLHATLAAKGYGGVKVVGADSGWEVADDMVKDPTFAKAVDIVGAHYPCHGGDGGDAVSCGTTSNALATGKPLWASENGSQDINSGTAALIRSITRGYLDAKMTAYLNWPLLAAIYPNLPYSTVGLAVAPSPWSGAYSTGKSTWATAQVTQFTKPGWHFIDSASGYLGTSGSYVTLTDGHDYSTVIETSTATAAQQVSFSVRGLNTSTAHVWTTSLGTGPDFQHSADVNGASYTLTLQPNTIYTISTTTGQGKGTAVSPAEHGLALPYRDGFEYASGTEAKYLSDMQGSYEAQPCVGRSGQCLTQMAPIRPIEWQDDSDAFSLIGDQDWGNYTVSADVRLAKAGTVELMGRANAQSRPQSHQDAYYFRVSGTGAWSIVSGDTSGTLTTLASGTTTALGTNAWHTLSVTFQGSTITGSVDGHTAGTATDGRWTNGQAGIGVVGYATDQFDNLAITPGAGSPARQGPITSGMAGKCARAGAQVALATCDGSAAQTWTVRNGSLVNSGQCMDVTGLGTANGTLVELWDCNGGGNQQWTQAADGSLRSVQSGKCLDDPGFSTTDGTQLEIWDCNGGANQRWQLPAA
ncbi:ricin-type beta-trefoil lectin domain protein [Kutzneria sp. NPDC051319]|uniref:ricin-type beta-trefoil lectin domain protein n=1 Tax=Kutzneria sp. NPDC051319 TaxID=3155047 RepID=UPI00342010B5